MHRRFCAGKQLAHLVKCMLSVVREWPYLDRPAALFDRVRPFLADKDVRTVNLVYRAITRAVMRYLLLGAADARRLFRALLTFCGECCLVMPGLRPRESARMIID